MNQATRTEYLTKQLLKLYSYFGNNVAMDEGIMRQVETLEEDLETYTNLTTEQFEQALRNGRKESTDAFKPSIRLIVQKDTIVRYKRSFVPKTRLETRIEYKLKRDTLKMIEKVEVIKYKTRKQENKKPNLWLFIIGFGAGFVTKWLLKFSKYTL